MATALQAQLAQIAAKSTNSLDLKAQRKAHSQSILFDPSVAAVQDFDTLYELCDRGFQELCHIDRRFRPFENTIFSEQSKQQDRTQVTASQDAELSSILESFLSLVGGRILLKPALLAIEWLIRRFRVHELNTAAAILTFLPYHALPVFTALLAILPAKLPPIFKFLSPYKQSLVSPPRHTIIFSAIHNPNFFNALNSHIIACCKRNHHYSALISFWASVTAESLAGQIDLASSRAEARRQKEDDVLFRILPTLNDGLSLRQAPDMRIACYLVLAMLASKLQLPDRVLDAMMDAVVQGSGPLREPEIVCLAALQQRRQDVGLPDSILQALLACANLAELLDAANQQYSIERLLLAIVMSQHKGQHLRLRTALSHLALSSKSLSDQEKSSVIESLLSLDDGNENHITQTQRSEITEVLRLCANDLALSESAKAKIDEAGFDVGDSAPEMQVAETSKESSDEAEDADDPTVDELLRGMPIPDAQHVSFLHFVLPSEYEILAHAASLAKRSPFLWNRISDLPLLQAHGSPYDPLYISFLLRFSLSTSSHSARAFALHRLADLVLQHKADVDFQILFPYLLVTLSDSSRIVRRAACELATNLHKSFAAHGSHPTVFGKGKLHNTEDTTQWLQAEDASIFARAIAENLEECKLDPAYIGRFLSQCLSATKSDSAPATIPKAAQREAVLLFIASVIHQTPLILVKSRLLHMLHHVNKVGSISRTKTLLPLVQHVHEHSTDATSICAAQSFPLKDYLYEVVNIVSAGSREGLKMLGAIAEDNQTIKALRQAALVKIHDIWPSIRPELQTQLIQLILRLAQPGDIAKTEIYEDAVDVLHVLRLPSASLIPIVSHLPELSQLLDVSSTKRRRTDSGHVDGGSHSSITNALQQWSFALELVASSHDPGDIELLRKLTALLRDMRSVNSQLGSQTNYVQTLLLDTLVQVVSSLNSDAVSELDSNAIPISLIVEVFESAHSSQVQRAALRLISVLAKSFPDAVIHHIMPAFTKMGQSVLQYNDEYSVQLADQAIEYAIPPLLDSFKKQKGGPQEGMVRLLLSFVAAYEHIPQERRLPLYSSLITRLGSDESLHLFFLLFTDKHGKSKEADTFVPEVMSTYPPVDQLRGLAKAVKVVGDAASDHPTTLTSQIIPSKDQKARLNTCAYIFANAARICSDFDLIRKVSLALSKDDVERANVSAAHSQLIEETLRCGVAVTKHKRLASSFSSFLATLFKLVPVHTTIAGLKKLVDTGDAAVLRQALASIEERVSSIRLNDAAAQEACLDLLPELRDLIKGSSDSQLLQTAISCIDSIVERFGKKDVQTSLEALRAVASASCVTSQDFQVRRIAMFCLATALHTLGESLVALVPQTMSLCYTAAEEALDSTTDSGSFNAAFAFFSAALDSMPWLVSRAQAEITFRLAHQAATNKAFSEETLDSRTTTLELLARRIESRECLAALTTTWVDATLNGVDAMIHHLHVIRALIGASSKSNTVRSSQMLFDLFLIILDLRTGQALDGAATTYTPKQIEEVEDMCSEIMVQMIYKLNDTHFRPLFMRLLEWALEAQEGASVTRHAAAYKFLQRFFDTLKSIVTSYAGLFIDDAAALLKQAPNEQGHVLWTRLMKTLHAAFEHDQDEYFQPPSRFEALCQPLVGQLSMAKSLEDGDVQETLIPCIVAFASAADSSENQKAVNVAVLAQLRAEDAGVRLTAASCQHRLTQALGEEWLAHLPEMLPFIGEVLEDDDEGVQNEVRAWVSRIEGIIGESLGPMLQ